MFFEKSSRAGFLLPTVLILSIVLLTIALGLSQLATTTVRSLRDKSWNRLADEAAQAGVSYAADCLGKSSTPWTSNLTPSQDCSGAAASPTHSTNYVSYDVSGPDTASTWRSSFSVTPPVAGGDGITRSQITGTVEIVASGAVVKSYSSTINAVLAGGSGAKSFTQISVGSYLSYTACAITTDHQAYCSGYNGSGGLGDGTNIDRHSPVKFGPSLGKSFSAVSASLSNSCGLTTVQTIYCSGENGFGQIGDDSTASHASPVQFGASLGKSFSAMSASYFTSCGLTTIQTIYCSGYNSNGQLGDDTYTDRHSPVQFGASLGKKFTAVSASGYDTCGLTTVQTIYCSGYNYYGALGNGTSLTGYNSPVQFGASLGKKFTAVSSSAQDYTSCGLTTEQTIYCSGYNSNGQLGDGSNTERHSPVQFGASLGKRFSAVSASQYTTCGLTTTQTIYCSGDNEYGQLGDGSNTERHSPVQFGASLGKSFSSVSAGQYTSCGLTTDQQVYCSGYNGNGQFGNGTTTNTFTPVQAFTL